MSLKPRPSKKGAKRNAQAHADPYGRALPECGPALSGSDISALFAGTAADESADPIVLAACNTCGGELRMGIDALRRVCADCGVVIECDGAEAEEGDAARPAVAAPRPRLVGAGSGSLQPGLYQSSSGDSPEEQQEKIVKELLRFRQQYIERSGKGFPIDALQRATNYYHEVRKVCVKRSLCKLTIMAGCIYFGSLDICFLPSNAEIAKFMQLPTTGIAAGVNFLRSLAADGKIKLSADESRPTQALVATLFAQLGLGKEAEPLRAAVLDIIRTTQEQHVGKKSFLCSRVAGATYAVLHRAAHAQGTTGLPLETCKAAAAIGAGGLQAFCGERGSRKNTVEHCLRDLEDYHSRFEEVYKRHLLAHERGIVKM